jgi:hypothetical protein
MKGCVVLIMLPFLIPIIAAIVFIVWIIKKGKDEGWSGTVIDKSHNTRQDDDNPHKTEHFYVLVVKTKERDRKVAVSAENYALFQIGDKIEKPKGSLFPKKVT